MKLTDVFRTLSRPLLKALEERGFKIPTEPQAKAIPLVAKGENVLLVAPTGTGKTEAAFLPIFDELVKIQQRPPGIRALYITPLRALNRDLLDRLQWWCKRLDIRLAVRHGDTEAGERGRQSKAPPDIMITTPETLQAIMTGFILRRHLEHLRWVVIDEVHELASDKRGSQLSIAMERLRQISGREFQVIGLSATVGTPEEVAKFVVGVGRNCRVVRVPVARLMKLRVIFPKPERGDRELAAKLYTYPEVAARLRALRSIIDSSASSLIFTNTRSEAEVLSSRFKVWDQDLSIGVHHSSLSRPSRVATERMLKEGSLRSVICTSSLEMGIDIGALDMVLQYNSPRQVTRLVQRVGRSGHRIDATPKGVIVTQDSDDALEAMVIVERAMREDLEPLKIPSKPLDVLTQQVAGLLVQKSRWTTEGILGIVTKAHPYRNLEPEELVKVLDYMHERYPRLVWFSAKDGYVTRPLNIKPLFEYYFQNLSMIPEEHQYLVLKEDETPVGMLDEAFVAEHGDIGTKFIEGGSVWRIIQIIGNKIFVEPEEDPTGAIPTWVGDEIPVPLEVALEVGRIRRKVEEGLKTGSSLHDILGELKTAYPSGSEAVEGGLAEVVEQVQLGIPVPTDKRITIEVWQSGIVVNCCFGHLVNRTLSRVFALMLAEKLGVGIGAHQDPYRIILKVSNLTPEIVKSLFYETPKAELLGVVTTEIVRTGLFKRRLIHVAKKFGALAKDVDLGTISLQTLVEGLKDSAVYDEAVRTVLEVDMDVEASEKILQSVKNGEIDVLALDNNGKISPISRIGIEELTRRADIVPPERLRKALAAATRVRLLSEGFTLVCTKCWNFVEARPVKELMMGVSCPECNSKELGLLRESENKVYIFTESMRSHRDVVAKRFRSLHRDSLRSAQLLAKFGGVTAVVLASRRMRHSDAEAILGKENDFNDRLIELIMDAEKEALKRGYLV